MSVEAVERAKGRAWKVRWRDDAGKARSKTFTRKAHAQSWDRKVKEAKELGTLTRLEPSDQTFEDFAAEWMQKDAIPRLEKATLKVYASMLDCHLIPRLGAVKLSAINREAIAEVRADFHASGVGPQTTVKALMLLRSMLDVAVDWDRISINPAVFRRGSLPQQSRSRDVRVMTPEEVEATRAKLLARRTPSALRDATLVSVLAYSGIRPQEALALTWGNVKNGTLRIERAVADGEFKDTKTRKRRSALMIGPLAGDLADYRKARGNPRDDALIFPRSDGKPWNREDYNNWRGRVWKRAAPEGATPYSLRHSYVSLLVRDGRYSSAEIAERLGHNQSQTQDTYSHVFAEFEGTERVPVEELIEAARAPQVSEKCPPEKSAAADAITQAA